ncbi:MAG TPA: response regulator [Pseudolabrys sp.]|jgi:CheY-like chemotaxis protein
MARILIIDDDEQVRGATKFLLVSHGFEAVAVADGKAGIEAIKTCTFDLIVVDLFMAGMNGLETMKVIREYNPQVPIIAVSGFLFKGYCPDMPNFEDMALEAGATTAMYKPIQPAEFLRAINCSIGLAA